MDTVTLFPTYNRLLKEQVALPVASSSIVLVVVVYPLSVLWWFGAGPQTDIESELCPLNVHPALERCQ